MHSLSNRPQNLNFGDRAGRHAAQQKHEKLWLPIIMTPRTVLNAKNRCHMKNETINSALIAAQPVITTANAIKKSLKRLGIEK